MTELRPFTEGLGSSLLWLSLPHITSQPRAPQLAGPASHHRTTAAMRGLHHHPNCNSRPAAGPRNALGPAAASTPHHVVGARQHTASARGRSSRTGSGGVAAAVATTDASTTRMTAPTYTSVDSWFYSETSQQTFLKVRRVCVRCSGAGAASTRTSQPGRGVVAASPPSRHATAWQGCECAVPPLQAQHSTHNPRRALLLAQSPPSCDAGHGAQLTDPRAAAAAD